MRTSRTMLKVLKTRKRRIIALITFVTIVFLMALLPVKKLMLLPNPWTSLTVQRITNGVYWIRGGVSNTGFIVTKSGVIVIDAQMFRPTARTQQEDIAKIARRPIRMIVLTHADPDHVNGLAAYPKGIEVVAQRNASRRMKSDLLRGGWGISATPSALRDRLPTFVVDQSAAGTIGGVPILLQHTAPAHTDGDLLVFLPQQRVVFAGDLLTPSIGPYPGLHLEKGGNSLGWIASIRAMLALKADIFVPGHGDALMTRKEVEQRLRASIERRAQIFAMVKRGLSLGMIKQTLREAPPAGAAALFPTFTDTTYWEAKASH